MEHQATEKRISQQADSTGGKTMDQKSENTLIREDTLSSGNKTLRRKHNCGAPDETTKLLQVKQTEAWWA
jgi:hypothetical protein